MSPAYAPDSRPRLAAIALLVLIHLALVLGMLAMRALRDRPGEGMLTILLRAPPPPERSAHELPAPAPARRLPALVAPVPAVALPERQAAPVAIAASAAPAGAGAVAATAGAASAPLNLAIPKEFFTHPPPLTPAQEAMQDPRSNHLELTRQEKLDIDFGVIECVAWERLPDGSIYRGPGHLKRIQSVGTNALTAHKPGQEDRPMECVR